MSLKQSFEQQMRQELEQLKADFDSLKNRAADTETNLEAEYFTRVEEFRIELQRAEQKLELFAETHDAQWETFKTDLEQSWESLRGMIRALTAP